MGEQLTARFTNMQQPFMKTRRETNNSSVLASLLCYMNVHYKRIFVVSNEDKQTHMCNLIAII